MKYSRELIDRITDKADIVSIIGKHVKLKSSGGEFKGCCPFHKEKTPSFSVNPQKNVYYCFGCHAKGNVIDFLCDYENLTFEDAMQTLSAQTGILLPKTDEPSIKTSYKKLPPKTNIAQQEQTLTQTTKNSIHQTPEEAQEGDLYLLLVKVAKYYQYTLNQTPSAKQYFLSRGLSEEVIAKFELGYAPNDWHHLSNVFAEDLEGLKRLGLVKEGGKNGVYDFFRNRVIFPIKNHRGQIVGFSGRALNDNDKPKYINSSDSDIFHKQELIYGFYEAREARAKEFLVVEGYMDVIALYQAGIFGAVASMGTALGERQIAFLLRFHDTLKFCFDGDVAGKNASWKALLTAAPLLYDNKHIKFITLPIPEDPDSFIKKFGKQAMQEKINNAKETSIYIYDILTQEFGTDTPEAKTKIISKANEFIEKLPNGNFKGLLKRDIYNKLYTKNTPSFRQTKFEQIEYEAFDNSNELDLCRYILYAPYILKQDPLEKFNQQIQQSEQTNISIQKAKQRLSEQGISFPSLLTWTAFDKDVQYLVNHIKKMLTMYGDYISGIDFTQNCCDANKINQRAHFIIATLPDNEFKRNIAKLWYEFFKVNSDKPQVDLGIHEVLCNQIIQILEEEQKTSKNNLLLSIVYKGRQEILKNHQRQQQMEYFTQNTYAN